MHFRIPLSLNALEPPTFLYFLSCSLGGKVNVNKLDAALEALNIKLTEKELDQVKDILKNGEWYRKSDF